LFGGEAACALDLHPLVARTVKAPQRDPAQPRGAITMGSERMMSANSAAR
jgi:hypothetical protein